MHVPRVSGPRPSVAYPLTRALLGSCTGLLSLSAGSLGSLVLKLGPKYDMGALCPDQNDGWQKAAKGRDWCVWIKKNE